MNISSILLAVFLLLFGVIYGFSVSFQYSALIVGLLAIGTAVALIFKK